MGGDQTNVLTEILLLRNSQNLLYIAFFDIKKNDIDA